MENRHVLLSTRRSGFTMIELLAVIIIMSIVGKMAYNATGQMTAKTRVAQAATMLAGNVQTAFSLAAKRRSPVRISIDTANKVFRVRDRATPAQIYLQEYYNNKTQVPLMRLQASDTTLTIFPTGLAAGTLTITAHTPGGNKRQISVTRAGQVRISTP